MRGTIVALPLALIMPVECGANEIGAIPLSTSDDVQRLTQKSKDLVAALGSPEEAKRNFVVNQMAAYEDLLRRDKTIQDLEGRKPGLIAVIKAKVASELERLAPAETMTSADALARIYSKAMTEQDIDVALAFYRSPVGVRMTERMVNSVKTAHQRSASERNPKAIVDELTKTASVAAFDAVGADDRSTVAEFMKSPSYLKMHMVAPKVQETVTQQLLASQARTAARVMPMITKAINAHFAKR